MVQHQELICCDRLSQERRGGGGILWLFPMGLASNNYLRPIILINVKLLLYAELLRLIISRINEMNGDDPPLGSCVNFKTRKEQ